MPCFDRSAFDRRAAGNAGGVGRVRDMNGWLRILRRCVGSHLGTPKAGTHLCASDVILGMTFLLLAAVLLVSLLSHFFASA